VDAKSQSCVVPTPAPVGQVRPATSRLIFGIKAAGISRAQSVINPGESALSAHGPDSAGRNATPGPRPASPLAIMLDADLIEVFMAASYGALRIAPASSERQGTRRERPPTRAPIRARRVSLNCTSADRSVPASQPDPSEGRQSHRRQEPQHLK
jgi:hypothetical protein